MAHVGDARRNDDERFREMIRNITEGRRPDSDNDEHRTRFFEVFRSLEEPDQAEHNTGMSEPLTRPELDAKLETIEVKMDGRISRIEEVAGDIKEALRTTQGDIQSLKKTVIVTAISTTVTIVLGVAAFNASLTNNMVAALGSGKDIGAALEQVRTQSMESERRAAQAAEQAKLAQAATTEALAEIKKVVDDIRATRLQDLQQ